MRNGCETAFGPARRETGNGMGSHSISRSAPTPNGAADRGPRANLVTIAHLSDVHLPNVRGFSARYWNIKRGLGWLNWHLKRKRIHSRAAIDALIRDLSAQVPDHIAVTGDLVNIGLPGEYEAARDWLGTVGTADRVSVVPGNHDIYVEPEGTAGVALWRAYMCSDAFGAGIAGQPASGEDAQFPYVRRIGPAALVGVNSSCATAVGYADGEVGGEQRARLAQLLDRLGSEGLARIVMIHHPPMPGLTAPRRSIRDAAEVAAVIERHGAELVLHGHNHRVSHAMIGNARVDGIASASALRALHDEPEARYTLYRVSSAEGRVRISRELRGLAPITGVDQELVVRIFGTNEFECAVAPRAKATSTT